MIRRERIKVLTRKIREVKYEIYLINKELAKLDPVDVLVNDNTSRPPEKFTGQILDMSELDIVESQNNILEKEVVSSDHGVDS